MSHPGNDSSCHDQPKNVGYESDVRAAGASPSGPRRGARAARRSAWPAVLAQPRRAGRRRRASRTCCTASSRARRRTGSTPTATADGRVPPQLPPALDRVAGARRSDRLHPPAAREDRAVRASSPRRSSPAAAVLRHRDDPRRLRPAACWSRATWAGRPRSRATPSTPWSLGATDVFAQAAILGLYDPDRSQTVTLPRQVRTWEAFLQSLAAGARRRARRSAAPGLRFLTGAVTSPTLAAQIRRRLRATSRRPAGTSGSRPAATRCAPALEARVRRVSSRRATTSPTADVVLTLDSDLLTAGPGAVRYARDFADRRRARSGERDA